MIKAVVPALLFVTAITGSASAESGFYTGNRLFELCQRESSTNALGYSVAVADLLIALAKVFIPDGVQAGQLEDIVCGYITRHPEKRHEPAHMLGSNALIEAFPCQK